MISHYYTESVTFVSPTTSTGTWTGPGWGSASSTIAAAVNPTAGQILLAGEREKTAYDSKLFCSDTVDIEAQDRVKYASKSYRVLFVKDTLNMGHHKTVYMKLSTSN